MDKHLSSNHFAIDHNAATIADSGKLQFPNIRPLVGKMVTRKLL